jgi:hypothetical protein
MKMTSIRLAIVAGMLGLSVAAGARGDVLQTYEDLPESFLGTSFHYNGVSFHDVNTSGVTFPDGSTATAEDVGSNGIVEDATLLYNDFPDFGSPTHALTFGSSYVVGQNLSLGAISTVTMDLDAPASNAGFELSYYENGPWSGIVYHLDALKAGQLVSASSFTIAGSDLNVRDNIAFTSMSVAAPAGTLFDQLKLYATFGNSLSAPRGLIDNLAITAVPEPASMSLALVAASVARRRRPNSLTTH